MSIEKAIEEISKMQFEHRNYRSAVFKKDGIPLMYTESVDLAIEALEKQIPEKVIVISSLETYCPCCDNELINNYYDFSYCEKCGQKIDWSEV